MSDPMRDYALGASIVQSRKYSGPDDAGPAQSLVAVTSVSE
ncbi:hypothetical protein [Roseibium sediminis]|nr:hypothetical protein [Roseibium sediminis]